MNQEIDRTSTEKARQHLYVALRQVAPSDDHVIIKHMRDAYVLLGGDPKAVPLPWETIEPGSPGALVATTVAPGGEEVQSTCPAFAPRVTYDPASDAPPTPPSPLRLRLMPEHEGQNESAEPQEGRATIRQTRVSCHMKPEVTNSLRPRGEIVALIRAWKPGDVNMYNAIDSALQARAAATKGTPATKLEWLLGYATSSAQRSTMSLLSAIRDDTAATNGIANGIDVGVIIANGNGFSRRRQSEVSTWQEVAREAREYLKRALETYEALAVEVPT